MNDLNELKIEEQIINPVEEINEDDLFVHVELDEKESEKLAAEPYSYWKSVFRIFIKKPSAIIALVSFVLFILSIIVIPMFTPEGWLDSNMSINNFSSCFMNAITRYEPIIFI